MFLSLILGQILMLLGLLLIVLRFFGLIWTDDVRIQVGIGLMVILFGWLIAIRLFFPLVKSVFGIFGEGGVP